MSDSFPLALDELKQRLPQYLRTVHGSRIKKQSDSQITMLCPHHDERTASFIADNRKGAWLFNCHGCGIGGSIIDLAQLDLGTTSQKEGIEHAAQVTGFQLPSSNFTELTKDEKAAYRRRKQQADKQAAKLQTQEAERDKITAKYEEIKEKYIQPYLSNSWKSNFDSETWVYGEAPEHNAEALISGLYDPEEIIWTGGLYDTGEPEHAVNFMTARETLATMSNDQPARISPSTFKAGSYGRTKKNVEQVKYICIEADDYSAEPEENLMWNAALIQFLRTVLGMQLRAVIFTGNKSLHAWFDPLPPDDMAELNTLAEGLGIDLATLNNSAAPLRLPHSEHEKTGKRAELLFLQPQKLEHFYK